MKPSPWLVVVLVGALAGLVFASVSTYDFVQHLDRQVHSLHCSFIPGAGADHGATGCQAAMMSPYSSVFRTTVWGGVPISLGAMAVFAFILFFGIDLLLTRRKDDPRATAFLALATGLPALASLVMLIVSLAKLGTTCKLCVGIYVASAMCVIGAVTLWRRAVAMRATMPSEIGTAKAGTALLEVQVESPAASTRFLGAMFGLGVLFVATPVILYLAMAPDHGRFVGTCGELVQPEDTYGVMVPIHRGGDASALEILDPLCPACKAFEQRLAASGFGERLDRKAILFPLDTTCNWMITENTHPGACTISEAVLCAGDRAPQVIAWAFANSDRIRAETKADPAAAARIVNQRFPDLASCVGSSEAKSRLNKSMRWAVANNIRVLTPQLFVNGVKLCDEDVDLGLDYALAKMIDGDMPARPRLATPVAPPTVAPPPIGTPAVTGTEPSQPATTPTETDTGETGATPTTPATTPAATTPGTTTPSATAPSATTPAPATTTPSTTTTAPATPTTTPGAPVTTPTTTDPMPAETKPADKPAPTATPPADKPPPPADKPAPPADKPAAPADTTGGTP